MTRPTEEETLVHVAYVFAARSTCSRAHVGAVFALRGRILATGYNGAPAGMPHCSHDEWRYAVDGQAPEWLLQSQYGSQLLRSDWTGSTFYLDEDQVTIIDDRFTGPPHDGCKVAIHAEANAIAFAARHGVCLEGTTLYTTLAPCLRCAQLIVNVGVVEIVCAENYRVDDGVRLLTRAGIDVRILDEEVAT